MSTPIIGDAINLVQMAWDMSPTPIKVLMGIFLASGLIAVLGMLVNIFDVTTGVHLEDKLTIGAHDIANCTRPPFPYCNVVPAVQAEADLVQTCVDLMTYNDPACRIHYYAVNSKPDDNNLTWGVWFYVQDEYIPNPDNKWSNQPTCNNMISLCNNQFQQLQVASIAIYGTTRGIDCSGVVDYNKKLDAWLNSKCTNVGGIYLLDYRLWFFGSLLFYGMALMLQYYGSTWK